MDILNGKPTFITTRKRREWAAMVATDGLQEVCDAAWLQSQHAIKRWICLLWEEGVIDQFTYDVDGEHFDVSSPSGAPLFVAGCRWAEFAAELGVIAG